MQFNSLGPRIPIHRMQETKRGTNKKEEEKTEPKIETETETPRVPANTEDQPKLTRALDQLERMNRTTIRPKHLGDTVEIIHTTVQTSRFEETPEGGLPYNYLRGLVNDIKTGVNNFQILAERIKSARTYEEKSKIAEEYIKENNLNISAFELVGQIDSASNNSQLEDIYFDNFKDSIMDDIINYYSQNCSDKDLDFGTVSLQIREILFGKLDGIETSYNMFNDSVEGKIYNFLNKILNDPRFQIEINSCRSYNWASE